MLINKLSKYTLAAILLITSSGCAAAYRDYEDGCVPLGYCPLPPLPYAEYRGCPTPIAERYSSLAASAGEKASTEPIVAADALGLVTPRPARR